MLEKARCLKIGLWTAAGLLSVALVVYVALGITRSHIYESVYDSYASAKDSAEAQRIFKEKCARLTAPEAITDCFDEYIATTGDARRAQEDLYAQKHMAEWAFWMLLVTGLVGVGTISITALGVYYIRDTLRATTSTLAAARASNDIMLADQRPWLHAELMVSRSHRVIEEGVADETFIAGFWLDVPVNIKNSGRTPAQNVRVCIGAFDEEQAFIIAESAAAGEEFEVASAMGAIAPGTETGKTITVYRYMDVPNGRLNDVPFICVIVVAIFYGENTGKSDSRFVTVQSFSIDAYGNPEHVKGITLRAVYQNGRQLIPGPFGAGEMR